MKLINYLKPEYIAIGLPSESKEELLDAMVELAARNPMVQDREKVSQAIHERERIMSTGVGKGFAIPHGKTDAVGDIVIAWDLAVSSMCGTRNCLPLPWLTRCTSRVSHDVSGRARLEPPVRPDPLIPVAVSARVSIRTEGDPGHRPIRDARARSHLASDARRRRSTRSHRRAPGSSPVAIDRSAITRGPPARVGRTRRVDWPRR